MAKERFKITKQGPLFINSSKHVKKGTEKALKIVGKSTAKFIRRNTPFVSGTLRRNIRENKPTIKGTEAFITISAGSFHGGATGVRQSSKGDVIYAQWIESGRRKGKRGSIRMRKRPYGMFKKAEKYLNSRQTLQTIFKNIRNSLD